MRPEYVLLFLTVGLGVYLTRYLPFLFYLLQRLDGEEQSVSEERLGWLEYVGPCVLAGLLVVSLLPEPGSGQARAELLASALTLVPTILVAVRYQNLGLTVLTGVISYWLIWLVL